MSPAKKKAAVKKAPAKKATRARKAAPRRTVATVQAELEAFKQRVIERTWEHPAGCEGGKREFLEDLGLKAPKQSCRFGVDLSIQTSDEGETEDELWEIIGDALNEKGYEFNIDRVAFEEYD